MPWDRRKYPKNWEAIVARIRERSGNRCECLGECSKPECKVGRCEARNSQPHPVTGSKVVLTTAHLDHEASSDDESRLRHFCQRCHLTYDGQLHAANAKATRLRRQAEAAQSVGQGDLFARDGGKP